VLLVRYQLHRVNSYKGRVPLLAACLAIFGGVTTRHLAMLPAGSSESAGAENALIVPAIK
jgi:hypothetical protein